MSWHNPQTQQARWLDALNTGPDEIPGYGVVWMNSAGLASDYGYRDLLPPSNYKGAWNAATNSPLIVSGEGTKGDVYRVSVSGSTSIDGESVWEIGDLIQFDGAKWNKINESGSLETDPYVIEVFQFPVWAATEFSSIKVDVGSYLVCQVQERYHTVMGLFAVNGPVPIPSQSIGRVTCNPPFVALCRNPDLAHIQRPVAEQWFLGTPQGSDPACGPPLHSMEWFRVLRDMQPGGPTVRPAFVDIDSNITA